MSELFKPVDSSEENAIIAAANQSSRKGKGPDLSIRTNTHWFTLTHNISEACTVPDHGVNIPDEDKSGQPYNKKRGRVTVKIGELYVCRWCFMGELDATS